MLRLSPMTDDDYKAYLSEAVPDYAQEQVRAGYWHADEAQQRARQQYQQLLPEGLNTADMHLFSLVDEALGVKVGMIWFGMNRKRALPAAFIYDFIVYKPYRRRGYASQALDCLTDMALELGARKLELHVFAHNQAARALYEKAGFRTASFYMVKEVGGR